MRRETSFEDAGKAGAALEEDTHLAEEKDAGGGRTLEEGRKRRTPSAPRKVVRVFKTLCQPRRHRARCAFSLPSKWIASCERVRFQFCTGWVQRSDAFSIPA